MNNASDVLNKSSEFFFGGVGLRHPHFDFLNKNIKQDLSFFEIISENYMNNFGASMTFLERIRENYPVAMHGVSLSIGSSDPIDKHYLRLLKNLVERIDPFLISDHFCWTGLGGHNSHDLLPLPMNKFMVTHIVDKVSQVQDFLGRKIQLENASAYLAFTNSDIPEWDFINEVANKSGCGLLLDINNVFVNSKNFNFDPYLYLDRVNQEFIEQIHLGGFTDRGDFLFDTHSKPVCDEVWKLFEYQVFKLLRNGCAKNNLQEGLSTQGRTIPVLVEWDDDLPDFNGVLAELKKAEAIANSAEVISSASMSPHFLLTENGLPKRGVAISHAAISEYSPSCKLDVGMVNTFEGK